MPPKHTLRDLVTTGLSFFQGQTMNTRSRKSSAGKQDSSRRSSRPPPEPTPSKKRGSRTLATPQTKAKTGGKRDAATARKVGECLIPVPAYEEQEKLLRSLLQSTARHVESNSILICGPRGCGKSTFVEQCLKSECDPKQTEVMYFNGFMDTETVKLFQTIRVMTESEDRSIARLMQQLKKKCTDSESTIVVILDEFDRFCKHADQTFLYNIFDLAQKFRQLCVIGMTTRLDCLELLEKRVKSRMNQTVINLNSPFRDSNEYLALANGIRGSVGQKEFKNELTAKKEFSKNVSLRNLKHLLIESMCRESISHVGDADPIVCSMLSLSHMEFLTLFVADNHCRNTGVRSLSCDSILRQVSKFTGRTRIHRDMAYKLIDNLVSYGLLKKASSRDSPFLNDWTLLHLNFASNDLRKAVSEMQGTLPAHLQVLINVG